MSATSSRQMDGLVERLTTLTSEIPKEVTDLLDQAASMDLPEDELSRLLVKAIDMIKLAALRNGDAQTLASLSGPSETIAKRILHTTRPAGAEPPRRQLVLRPHGNVKVEKVVPAPRFQGESVPMMVGTVPVTELELWDANERLDIHLSQFRIREGRDPSPDELLEIMLSKMKLPGIQKKGSSDDQFRIVELARSIATDGMRRPPIIDQAGTLLDGNRRVAACRYILSSPEFDIKEQERAQNVVVWQLTEHATDADRNRVVVSLNFESDYKLPWPEYVKARKIFDEWQAMIQRESVPPGDIRQKELRKSLGNMFAIHMNRVERYIRMASIAADFEHHHILNNQKDPFVVKHIADRYVQYFDELSKGRDSGVRYVLDSHPELKALVFDLLAEGKFRNFTQLRDLRFVPVSKEARHWLETAHKEPNIIAAQESVRRAITAAHLHKDDARDIGADHKIETFVSWLSTLRLNSYWNTIDPESLRRLLAQLKRLVAFIESQLEQVANGNSEVDHESRS